jgi:hypothetical protein
MRIKENDQADVREIVDHFHAGVPKYVLATDYGMSLSTMQRLLRKHRKPS